MSCRSIVPYSTVWSTRPAPCLWKKLIVIILCRLHGGCLYQHQLLKVPCVLMLAYLLCNFSPCLYSLLLQSWKRCWFLLSSFMARKFNPFPDPKRGKGRSVLKRPAAVKPASWKKVKYTRDTAGVGPTSLRPYQVEKNHPWVAGSFRPQDRQLALAGQLALCVGGQSLPSLRQGFAVQASKEQWPLA